ncbi:hypothetical protein KIL84_006171 [Mauremys mutica]|uniref:Uncharacterized protein n=1 Tax=Mauremys mutica TaxID=74926 RepID=A0A9D3X0Z9_9SAUR|nr:hypothetical protein KIL84_006171 [Mauremys mutica]
MMLFTQIMIFSCPRYGKYAPCTSEQASVSSRIRKRCLQEKLAAFLLDRMHNKEKICPNLLGKAGASRPERDFIADLAKQQGNHHVSCTMGTWHLGVVSIEHLQRNDERQPDLLFEPGELGEKKLNAVIRLCRWMPLSGYVTFKMQLVIHHLPFG